MPTETQTVVKETAGQFNLNFRDLALGAIVAAGSAASIAIYDAFQSGGIDAIDWKVILQVAIGALIGYLGKNFFTKQKTIIMAPKEDVKITEKSTGDTLIAVDGGKGK